jgi:hypothetical protein
MIKTVNRLVNGLLTAHVATAPGVFSRARTHRSAKHITLRHGTPCRSHSVGPSGWKVAHNTLVTGLVAN